MPNFVLKFTGLCGLVPKTSQWNAFRNEAYVLLVDARGSRGGLRDEPHQPVLVFQFARHISGANLRLPDVVFDNPRTGEKMGLCYLKDQQIRIGAASDSLRIVENGGGSGCHNPHVSGHRESFSWIAPMANISPGAGRVHRDCLAGLIDGIPLPSLKSEVIARVILTEGTLKTNRLASDTGTQVVRWEFRPDAGGGHKQALAEEVQLELPIGGDYISISATRLRGGGADPFPLVLSSAGNVTAFVANMPLDDILGVRIPGTAVNHRDPDYDFVSLYSLCERVPTDKPVPFPEARCQGSGGPTASNPQCPPARFDPLVLVESRGISAIASKAIEDIQVKEEGELGGDNYASPRLVVKFKEGVVGDQGEEPESILRLILGEVWERMAGEFPGLRVERLFSEMSPGKIIDLDRKVFKDVSLQRSELLDYFALYNPLGSGFLSLVPVLNSLPSIEIAYDAGPPNVPPESGVPDEGRPNPRLPSQFYLTEAPVGVGMHHAWSTPGGDGHGSELVDIEEGWAFNHEDLPQDIEPPLSGLNVPPFAHGTRTLGIVAAIDNAIGIKGIAYRSMIKVVSVWRSANEYSIAAAILDSVRVLRSGSVLLIEVQSTKGFGNYPCEVDPAVFAAILRVVARGIIVVEAAGNGGRDLDDYRGLRGRQILKRDGEAFRDSGAILVGAGTSGVPHSRMPFSNYGSRIDCYAWGENILSTGGVDLEPGKLRILDDRPYASYGFQGGTSGAAAIIAGVAASLQGIAQMKHGRRFRPMQMRRIIGNPNWGTASANPAQDRIATMPDLKKILDANPIPE